MRTRNRPEAVTESLRAVLNAPSIVAPAWLRAWTTPAWVDRHGPRASDFRVPKGEAAR
jgi:hypothetical protein